MILPVFILFGVLSLLFLNEKGYSKPSPLLLVGIFSSLLLIITFRPIEMPDARNYINNFMYPKSVERFEIGYLWIRDCIRSIGGSYRLLFSVIGIISLAIKFSAIQKISPFIYGSLLVYLSYFFVLHDMIQIRAGIASGIILWSIYYITKGDILKFTLVSLLAVCFHYSALSILLLWFVPYIKINRVVWFLIIPICYLLVISGVTLGNLISYISYEPILYLFISHTNAIDQGVGDSINIFNLLLMSKCLICTYLIIRLNKIEKVFTHVKTWLMVYTIALATFLLFSDIPVVAFRISELFQIVEIVLIPLIVYSLRPNYLGKLLVLVITISMLLIITFYNNFLL